MNSRKAKRLRREAALAMFAMDGQVPDWINRKAQNCGGTVLPRRQILKALKQRTKDNDR